MIQRITRLLPGLALCLGVTGVAGLLEHWEAALTGRAWLEALVLSILLGTVVRSLWTPSERWQHGIHFGAKMVLEIAVVLLGASVSFAAILAIGPALLVGIVLVVILAIAASYTVARLLKLPHRMALLVACGNSICGNSAIAAVAPVIGAKGQDVAAAIAFTAVLGVAVVLTLPLVMAWAGLNDTEYGVLAGLTVYAVPQVLAATIPVSAVAAQVGTLVKLVRVLMLGPVVLTLALMPARLTGGEDAPADRPSTLPINHMVPWFVLGFLSLSLLRSLDVIPAFLLPPIARTATALTVISMAALGLGVDIRSVARAGGRVTAAVTLSIILLGGVSLALIVALR